MLAKMEILRKEQTEMLETRTRELERRMPCGFIGRDTGLENNLQAL